MQYRKLGRTDIEISEVGFGGAPLGIRNYLEEWDPDSAKTERVVQRALEEALECGYNFFDTAAAYGDGRSEELIGSMLADNHDECYVATKTPLPGNTFRGGGWTSVTSEYVFEQTEQSLDRLQVDSIDLLQVHGEVYTQADRDAIFESVVPAYEQLRADGDVDHFGITLQSAMGIEEIIRSDAFDVLQIRYNVIYQEPFDTFLDMTREHDIGVLVMRPMTSGIFQQFMRSIDAGVPEEHLYEQCLRFVLSDPRISSAVVGMRRASEVRANEAVSESDYRFDLDALHDRHVE